MSGLPDRLPEPVRFTVEGQPCGKGRPRFANGRTYTPAKTADAEDRIILFARMAMRGKPLYDGDVAVDLTFEMKGKRRTDVDNLAKLVLDSLNGVCFRDDSQVTRLTATVTYGVEQPLTTVEVSDA